MTKYEQIISKIYAWKKDPFHSTYNFNQSEIELITDALETIQFLEIILAKRAKKENLETHV